MEGGHWYKNRKNEDPPRGKNFQKQINQVPYVKKVKGGGRPIKRGISAFLGKKVAVGRYRKNKERGEDFGVWGRGRRSLGGKGRCSHDEEIEVRHTRSNERGPEPLEGEKKKNRKVGRGPRSGGKTGLL